MLKECIGCVLIVRLTYDIHVKIKESGLDLFYFSFHFLFYFLFSIFRITKVRVDQSHCHISHNLMA